MREGKGSLRPGLTEGAGLGQRKAPWPVARAAEFSGDPAPTAVLAAWHPRTFR